LLIYDAILTFPQEIRCIWQRKWSGATLLYVTIRYLTLLDIALEVVVVLVVPSSIQLTESLAVFESLRVWAISGKSWILATVVLALAILAPVTSIVCIFTAICSDIIVLTITVQKTFHAVRIANEQQIKARFTSLLLYTGECPSLSFCGLI
ncbi:hypothetical protein K474DRAFT_1608851, partial [Panus rudis PR-1116 ss-1]